MEAPEGRDIDPLKELACSLVSDCTDEDLLDLICRLLAQSIA